MLYIMTERRSIVSRYRNAFESVKQTVFDQLLCGGQQPRTTITAVATETGPVHDVLKSVYSGSVAIGLSNMIDSISGRTANYQELDLADCDFLMDNLDSTMDLDLATDKVRADNMDPPQTSTSYDEQLKRTFSGSGSDFYDDGVTLAVDAEGRAGNYIFRGSWDPKG